MTVRFTGEGEVDATTSNYALDVRHEIKPPANRLKPQNKRALKPGGKTSLA